MDPDFKEKVALFGLGGEESQLLRDVGAQVLPKLDEALDGFYGRAKADPKAAAFFTSPDRMDFARRSQIEHWKKLFLGTFDEDYQASVERIGATHARIDLPPNLYMSAYSLLAADLMKVLCDAGTGLFKGSGDLARRISVINRAFTMDMALVVEAIFRLQGEEQAKAFSHLNNAIDKLAAGNLTHYIPGPHESDYPERYDDVRQKMNSAISGLGSTVSRIAVSMRALTDSVAEVTGNTDDLSRRTENQAASLEETAAAMQELSSQVDTSARDTRNADTVAQNARASMEQGVQIVADTAGAMLKIQRSSTQISQIIGLIDDVAFQTNLLALNAGVEAARAGEAGRGFSVVASEVRTLAGSTSEAAKEIKTLISQSAAEVDSGVTLTEQANQTFESIVESFGEVSSLSANVAGLIGDQAKSVAEINTTVGQIDRITQQNAQMVQDINSIAQVMTSCSSDVQALLSALHFPSSEGDQSVQRRSSAA